MLKEKRSFFEKLTGTSPADYAEENNYDLSGSNNILGNNNDSTEEKVYDNNDDNDNDGQLAVDVFQGENEVIIQSIVAGVRPEDLDISIDKDSVSIRGKRERNRLTDRETALCQELYWGSFSRTISLSDEIDSENAEAVTKNGVLTIRLPLARKTQVKKIRVTEE